MDSPHNFNNLSERAKTALFNGISNDLEGGGIIKSGTPVSAVQAEATLTAGGAPSNGKKVTIGSTTYTFVTNLSSTPTVAYEVKIGTAAVSLDNLKAAINADAGEGTTYGMGTVAHPDVTATTNTDTTQLIVAKVAGDLGYPTTTDDSNLSWSAGTTTGGVDGTAAKAGQMFFDSTYLYIATADNTTSASSNWKQITLEAFA